ncbi:glycosyltransferase family 2 protein [Candidatus Roizmanbacteria bacterium]|nr:glycosyltransferase family 2 protein [Candidatus Roizmanbacteria bacterium]
MKCKESIIYQPQKIHPMFEQPPGWLLHRLPKFQELLRSGKGQKPGVFDTEKYRAKQEKRWTDDVGIAPQDTHVTVVMPIHDEAKCLSSALGTLAMSDLPDSANVRFLFFLNGCRDQGKSRLIVEDFLRDIGPVEEYSLGEFSGDPKIAKTGKIARRNNVEFLLVESGTASKTNALNTANVLAHERGDKVTVNVDANNWLEPDALRYLIASAYRAISSNEALVLGGKSMISYKQASLANFFERAQKSAGRIGQETNNALHGWLIAWDTSWLQKIGGIPKVACDDYTLSLESRKAGKKVLFVNEAAVWGYHPNNIADKMRAYARIVRDKIQIKHAYEDQPDVIAILEQDEPYMRKAKNRLSDLVSSMGEEPKNFLFYLARFMVWETAKLAGEVMYKCDPNSQTWSPIKSTK